MIHEGIQPTHGDATRRVQRSLAALAVAFVLCHWGANLWFRPVDLAAPGRLSFSVGRELAGWGFRPEAVSPVAAGSLGTTNLFNGTFEDRQRERVTAFAAFWAPDAAGSLSAVQHTPDLCWVGAGWWPVEMGQPDRVEFRIGTRTLPFECRVFTAKGASTPELVVWCTLLGGEVLEESWRWRVAPKEGDSPEERLAKSTRRLAASQFLANVVRRRRADREKAFVRISVPVRGTWAESLERLQRFAGEWLTVREAGGPLG